MQHKTFLKCMKQSTVIILEDIARRKAIISIAIIDCRSVKQDSSVLTLKYAWQFSCSIDKQPGNLTRMYPHHPRPLLSLRPQTPNHVATMGLYRQARLHW